MSLRLLLLLMLQAFGNQEGRFLEAALTTETGTHDFKVYVPASYRSGDALPLLIVLHGCTQDAADVARGTRFNQLAERERMIVAYPEQLASAHPQKCWNWYMPEHQERGRGEPAIIAAITRTTTERYGIDAQRVYLAGVSAGAAMATLVAAAYPELYAAVGLHSGPQYRAATTVAEALAAMREGGPDPVAQGTTAHAAMGERSRPLPIIIFQGGRDAVVAPVNGVNTLAQWAQTNDLADNGKDDDSVSAERNVTEQGETAAGYHYARTVHKDVTGRVLLEKWLVDELGHAWSGGAPEGTYTDPKGPDASSEMLRFFREASRR